MVFYKTQLGGLCPVRARANDGPSGASLNDTRARR
jgi:hypothetical protein